MAVRKDSHQRTLTRFDNPGVASRYPSAYSRSFRERLESRAILKALTYARPKCSILDVPCGTGRLTPLLVGAGFRVTGADSSRFMASLARDNWDRQRVRFSGNRHNVAFSVQDALNTDYDDNEFEAVICNRLFHHFAEPAVRIAALRELRRIASGAVVVSFFNSFALDALKFRLKHFIRGTAPSDRIPVPMEVFAADVKTAGLEVVATIPVLWGFSPMWYVVAR